MSPRDNNAVSRGTFLPSPGFSVLKALTFFVIRRAVVTVSNSVIIKWTGRMRVDCIARVKKYRSQRANVDKSARVYVPREPQKELTDRKTVLSTPMHSFLRRTRGELGICSIRIPPFARLQCAVLVIFFCRSLHILSYILKYRPVSLYLRFKRNVPESFDAFSSYLPDNFFFLFRYLFREKQEISLVTP